MEERGQRFLKTNNVLSFNFFSQWIVGRSILKAF